MSLKNYAAAIALAISVAGVGADVIEVQVQDFQFAPDPVVIQPGDTVRWVWVGNVLHTSDAASGFTEFWDSPLQGNGTTFEYTFNSAGTFPYFCDVHGADQFDGTVSGMSSMVIVEGVGMTNNGLAPAIAGQSGTLWANGATPGDKVYFVYGFKAGSTNVPGCGGLTVDIAKPTIIGSPVADANGVAQLTVAIPSQASGVTILTQAVDLDACMVSNAVSQALQ